MDDDLIILNYYNLIAAVVKRAHLDVELEKNRKRQWNPAEGDCPRLFLEDMQQVDVWQVPMRRQDARRTFGSEHGRNWVVT